MTMFDFSQKLVMVRAWLIRRLRGITMEQYLLVVEAMCQVAESEQVEREEITRRAEEAIRERDDAAAWAQRYKRVMLRMDLIIQEKRGYTNKEAREIGEAVYGVRADAPGGKPYQPELSNMDKTQRETNYDAPISEASQKKKTRNNTPPGSVGGSSVESNRGVD